MRVKVPLDFVLHRIEDIEAYKKGPAVLQVGKFQSTPEEQDLRSLQLLPADIASLPNCQPMACDVKLSADMMKQIQSQLGGRNGASARNVERAFQNVLFQYFQHYLEHGKDALITYQDKPQPVSLAEVSAGALQEFGWIRTYAPALWSRLEHQDPPDRNPASRGDYYYWSKEKAGLKAVVSLTQVTMWRSMVKRPSTALIASKQLYASHYFEASLGLTVLIDDSTAEGPAIWIAYFNRSSVDAFDGWLGGLKRSLAVLRLPSALRGNLIQTKRNLENGYTAAREPRFEEHRTKNAKVSAGTWPQRPRQVLHSLMTANYFFFISA